MKKLTFLTGAGISAESGIKTFRDSNGLWEGHDVMEVASPEGFASNPQLVLDFYNQRRKQLLEVTPNRAHYNVSKLEEHFETTIITQNVDDLHERAGSSRVYHLHGELLKVRSTVDDTLIYNWNTDVLIGDLCEKKSQLRPHIVWFGEMVPMLDKAIEITQQTDILVVIGTSLQVYPAANLIHYVPDKTPIYFIDPKPTISKHQFQNVTIIKDVASSGTDKLTRLLTS